MLLTVRCYDIAYSLLMTGQVRRTEELCRDMLREFPSNLDFLFVLGSALVSQKEYKKGIQVFKRFLYIRKKENKNPKYTHLIIDTLNFEHKAFGNISDCYFELGNLEKARACTEKAIRLRPDLPVYKASRSRILLEEGKIAEARQVLSECEQSGKTDAAFYLRWGALCRKYPDLGKAVDILKRGLIEYSTSDELHNSMAYIIHSEEPGAAENEWLETLDLNPDHIGAHVGLSKLYARSGRIGKLEKEAEYILANHHESYILKEVGGYCLHAEQYSRAADLFSKYLYHVPTDVEVLADVASCYARMGCIEAALIGYKEALCISPKDPTILRNLKILQNMAG